MTETDRSYAQQAKTVILTRAIALILRRSEQMHTSFLETFRLMKERAVKTTTRERNLINAYAATIGH